MKVGCKAPCEDIERLKVCGTCRHMHATEYLVCEHPDRTEWDDEHYVSCCDKCDMPNRPRWVAYWEKP